MVVVYLAILQGLGALIGVDTGSKGQFATTEAILRNGLIPIGLSVLFGAAVVTWLGWWGDVMRYRVPVRRWVRFVPIAMLVAAVLGANYRNLADQPLSLVLSLIAMTLLVGVGEELMFRGIGVQVFKQAGFTEGKVALWSSLIFGLAHVSNAFGEGSQAIVQAVVVSTSGYFFYLCLRVGGTLLLPMLVHGLWDFGLISNSAGVDPEASPGMVLPILLQVALIVLVIVKRRSISPATGPDTENNADSNTENNADNNTDSNTGCDGEPRTPATRPTPGRH
ncbi:CPBP family intramembrane glutamic endopeptidase [Streptomyces sp. SR27]|uniref:CPBP family intramembrane glutamic endopeptidase n=1 Tax=Streptomyces sp. SR27 TaxID=3076630 RepID=UPI00295B749C|nr:CPBP family intramembrane glutamic endopeptidase [Streptomyces sp. SR27]MDV9190459.1 CPBP family intramembrane glutamic endopeptidase [Streptomyces sp. SR27]